MRDGHGGAAGWTAREGDDDAGFDAPADRPLLLSAEAAGRPWPSSCRNGTCRTCIRRRRAGEVRYRIEWPGLSAEEKREGWILPCVAYPMGDLVLAPDHELPVT